MILGRLLPAFSVVILALGTPAMADAFKDCVAKNAKELGRRAPSQADVDAATRWILGTPSVTDIENPTIMKIRAVQKTSDDFNGALDLFYRESKQVKTQTQAKEVLDRAAAAAGDAFWAAITDPSISELIVDNFGSAGQELLFASMVNRNLDFRLFLGLFQKIQVAHWMCR